MSTLTIPYEEVNELWFGGLDFAPGQPYPEESFLRWFRQSDDFDNKCRKYEPLIRKLVELPLPSLLELGSTPEKSLVIIILLDQISRNTMRGDSVAWVYTTCDPISVQFAYHCIKEGHDKTHVPHKQFWYYMPLSHSESLADKELKNAQLVWEIRQGEWKEYHSGLEKALDHCIKFYRVIEKFGRFPNRNPVLKRETTAEEKKFLEEGGWNVTA